jgi:hypothetical protein
LWAIVTAWARFSAPSLLKMDVMWNFTVLGDLELGGDLLVGLAGDDEVEDVALACSNLPATMRVRGH